MSVKTYQNRVTELLGNMAFPLVRFEFIYIIKCCWEMKNKTLSHSMRFPSILNVLCVVYIVQMAPKMIVSKYFTNSHICISQMQQNSMKKRNNEEKK